MKIRIAIVVNSFPALSETFIFNKVKGLAKEGFDVTVITHSTKNDLQAYQDQWQMVKEVNIVKAFSGQDIFKITLYVAILSKLGAALAFLRKSKGRLHNWNARIRAFLKWLRLTNSFDIIHFEYSGLAVSYLDVIAVGLPAKIMISCRGAAEQIRPLHDKKRASDLITLFQKADRVHCVSDDMLTTCATLYQLDRKKAFVNRPAIQPERFQRAVPKKLIAGDPIVICSTGRLHWKKGFEFSLLAMRLLKARGILFRYEIIGGGEEFEKLVFIANDLGIADHVHFMGRLSSSEVKHRLENCDIFLLPSLSEGISNAVLEAMAMKIPVVSTTAGGMDELITDMETGMLVNTYRPEELANKIEKLIEDYTLRMKLGENGFDVVQNNFTMQRQIDVFLKEYNFVIND